MRVSSLWCANINNSGPVRGSSGTGLRDHGVKLPWMSQYDITAQQVSEETRQENEVQRTWFNLMSSNRTNSIKLKWPWSSCSNYGPRSTGFEFITLLNAYKTVWCTETDRMWRINGPYSAPRPPFKGQSRMVTIYHGFRGLHNNLPVGMCFTLTSFIYGSSLRDISHVTFSKLRLYHDQIMLMEFKFKIQRENLKIPIQKVPLSQTALPTIQSWATFMEVA
jgi:hypothetical protein